MIKNKKSSKIIAFQDGDEVFEFGLPYPYVYYPGHYGAFLAFSKDSNSKIYFCSCSKKSIESYIKLRNRFDDTLNSNPLKNFILSISCFPKRPVENLYKLYNSWDLEIASRLDFKDQICHECNIKTPKRSYCHNMYGGVFEQNFGWYINKQSFEYGIKPVSYRILEEECPDEVFSLLEISKQDFLSRYNIYSEQEWAVNRISSDPVFQKNTRRIRNIIENEVRVKFRYKKVGEAWASETLLYELVCEVFSDKKIYRHYRPSFLKLLELDVFIPHLKIGIEYQGIQHFQATEYWGGIESLKKVNERDEKKKRLCDENGVKLIYFYYYEELSKELITYKINTYK